MPRKGPVVKTPVVADPVYNSPVVTALINRVLLHGKRSTAESIVYGALEGSREKTQVDPVITLKRALDNIKPAVALVELLTRYQLKLKLDAQQLLHSVGSLITHAYVARSQWQSAS
jgi:ribosomal protein S7